MAARKRQRAQAAMEYLITYGWALVAIATIIGVLVFATGGAVNTDTCTTFLTLVCKGIGADGDTLVMILQNATGQKITINPFTDIAFGGIYGYAVIEYQGTEYRFQDVTIGAGDEFKIKGYGMALEKDISITYKEGATGFTRTLESSLGTDAENDTELSNDGEDNDNDGAVDCAQSGVGPCEYLAAPTVTSPQTDCIDPTGTACQITFGPAKTTGGANLTEGELWRMPSVTVIAYISSRTTGSTGHVVYSGIPSYSSSVKTLSQGWNEFQINTSVPQKYYNGGANVGSFNLIIDSGSFTALRDESHQPKLLVNLYWPS